MHEIHTTIVGNLTADPELRYTASGTPVASFTVANTPRRRTDGGQWEDGEATFVRCSLWRQAAENLAASASKGTRVVVTGKLRQSNWETETGEKRSTLELDADEVGISVAFTSVRAVAAERTSGQEH